jgi:GDPmannose 4,6-dehydratase
MKKTALITGIKGQDGSYLAELLLDKGYHVVGFGKNHTVPSDNISHLLDKIELITGDLSDDQTVCDLINQIKPNEVYNFASQSYPGQSWDVALETMMTNGISAHRLFDIIKQSNLQCRVYQASSSEMYGDILATPQDEQTPFSPVNPYAAAKLYAHNIARIYRNSYNMFISCGILFNHESPRRGMHFITQKVTYAAACIKLGIKNSILLNEQREPIVKDSQLSLGNLNAKRDWGYAGDYVHAMWLMLQQDKPDDFVIGTGELRTIQELCETAFSYVDLDWRQYVTTDPRFIRPTETCSTVANPAKAKKILGWQPQVSFNELITGMVKNHLDNLTLKKM